MLELDGYHRFCEEMLLSFMELYVLWILCCALEECISHIPGEEILCQVL